MTTNFNPAARVEYITQKLGIADPLGSAHTRLKIVRHLTDLLHLVDAHLEARRAANLTCSDDTWDRLLDRAIATYQLDKVSYVERTAPPRQRTDPTCPTCTEIISTNTTHFPWHDASTRCQSGRHAHCTCDICF